jgi:hypothetical protein
MPSGSSSRYLSPALTVFGLIFLLGIYPLTRLWPSGWSWTPAQPAYLQMILGIYATLGIFPCAIEVSFGLRCGPVWYMRGSWRTIPSKILRSGVTCGGMWRPCCWWHSSWEV